MPDALHDAARLLIGEASAPTIRAVLRMLLDDVAPASAADASPRTARPARRNGKHAPGQAKAADPEWLALKARLRTAMAERGADYAAIGAAIGQAANTVRQAINRTLPPSAGMRATLAAWLEALEVAAPALPFRAGRSPDQVRGGNGGAAA
jgi:hypothetical protein